MTTPDDRAPRRSLSKDLKDIWQVTGLLALVITFVTFGTSAVLSAVVEPATKVSDIVFGTWPLVISAAVLTLMIVRGTFKGNMSALVGSVYVAALVVFPYAVAQIAGVVDRYEDAPGMKQLDSWNILGQILRPVYGIIRYYLISFGIGRTLLAVLCGVFVAWALQYKLLPHAQRLIVRRATAAPSASNGNG